MKRILLGLVALGAITSVAGGARAQDWRDFHDWSGPYVGVQAGYEWGTSKGDPLTYPLLENPVPFSFTQDGVLGGLHGGYNFQYGQIVLGVEGDVEGAGVSGQQTVNSATSPSFPYTFKTTMDFDASVRGRLGFAVSKFLVYGTGGVAWGDFKTSYSVPNDLVGNHGTFYNLKGTRTGWTAGGGVDYAIDRHWSVNVEYRYTDFGTQSYAAPPPVNSTDRNNITSNAVRLGVTWHFPPPAAMVAVAPPPPPPAPMPAAAPAPAPAPQARTFIVFFDFDKYNLTPDARKVVEEAANAYKAGGSAKVTLAGYTDLSGSVPYNLKLSERRAKTVAAAMSKMGVPASAMDVSWHGKENPRVPTPDGVREPQNRRVEISE